VLFRPATTSATLQAPQSLLRSVPQAPASQPDLHVCSPGWHQVPLAQEPHDEPSTEPQVMLPHAGSRHWFTVVSQTVVPLQVPHETPLLIPQFMFEQANLHLFTVVSQ
jgi:hypothetical protein